MIKSEIVAHSLSPQGDELISVLCTFPRIILAEVNTHRMLSKNTSSSRAIPFKKMLEAIDVNPFVPIAWQKEHSGMQGTEYHTDEYIVKELESMWVDAKDSAVHMAETIGNEDVTKQICNRLLEPFMWTTMLITGSREGWDNFFHLRCPTYVIPFAKIPKVYKSKKDCITENEGMTAHQSGNFWFSINKGQAEIHMMALAEAIWDSVNESTPKQLKSGDWHIPFENKIVEKDVDSYLKGVMDIRKDGFWGNELIQQTKVEISTAMAARTSYTMVGEEKTFDLEKMIGLHDRLIKQTPPHSSPLEHCAQAMTDDEHFEFRRGKLFEDTDTGLLMPADNDSAGWCFNLKGFISYRYIIDKQYK